MRLCGNKEHQLPSETQSRCQINMKTLRWCTSCHAAPLLRGFTRCLVFGWGDLFHSSWPSSVCPETYSSRYHFVKIKLLSKNCCYFKRTLTSGKNLHIPHKNILQYFSTEILWSLLLLVKRKKRGTTYMFLIQKNKAKMTKRTFAPHRPYLLISPFSSLYMSTDFLCVYIYGYTYDEIYF